MIAIDGFPEKSFTGILRELDSLPFNFRYCQQAQLLDEQEAKEKHSANKSKWGFRKAPPMRKLSPIKTARSYEIVDEFAAEMELDARRAMSLAEHGKEINVRFSAKIILLESDTDVLRRAIDAIVRTVKYHCGFSCRIETVNVLAAWLASVWIPTNVQLEFIRLTNLPCAELPLGSPPVGAPDRLTQTRNTGCLAFFRKRSMIGLCRSSR